MRIFFSLVVCIASLTATAQTITLPHPDSIATKEWVRKLLQGQEPPAVPSVPVVPIVEPCKAGPEIRQITGISQAGAVFQFHGENVFSLAWEIVGTGFAAVVKPTSNQITIAYKLEPGTYTLRIQGVSCAGVSTKSFTVPGATSEVVPVPVPDPVYNGEVKPQIITQGYEQHINIQISGTSGNWILNDVATVKKPDNYEWWYFIGGDIIKTDQNLTNYNYHTDAPLRVLKMAGKRGLKSFNYWGDETSWQDKDAGWGFERNISGAFMTFVFTGSTPIPSLPPAGEGLADRIRFFNPVPSSFKIDGFQKWDGFPAVKLPKGHLYHMRKIRPTDSVEKLMASGVTHVSNYDLPWDDHGRVAALRDQGITYNDVPNNSHIFNLPDNGVNNYVNGYNTRHWPNGELTEQQARAAARNFQSDHAIWIAQSEEGEAYMPADRPMWGWFYDELQKAYQERFGTRDIPYYIAHNYFWIGQPKGFDLLHCNRAEAKAALQNVPVNRYSPGHSLQHTNLIVEGIYNSFPDGSIHVYDKLHKLDMFRKMGKDGILFAFGVHEWRPNNYYRLDIANEGTLYRQDKMPVDPNYLVSMSFFSQVYGKGIFEWGPVPSTVTEKKPLPPDQHNADKWFPTGATDSQTFPWYSQSNYYNLYTGSSDFIHIGQILYSETFADFHQQALKYAKFRVDGGEWIQPTADGSDLVDAFHDKRAIVGYKVKDNQAALFYIHPTTNSTRKNLEVEINGKIYTATVAGTGVHASAIEL